MLVLVSVTIDCENRSRTPVWRSHSVAMPSLRKATQFARRVVGYWVSDPETVTRWTMQLPQERAVALLAAKIHVCRCRNPHGCSGGAVIVVLGRGLCVLVSGIADYAGDIRMLHRLTHGRIDPSIKSAMHST